MAERREDSVLVAGKLAADLDQGVRRADSLGEFAQFRHRAGDIAVYEIR